MTTAGRRTERGPDRPLREGGGDDADRNESDPVLSVVVVTYDEVDQIGECLESVLDACDSLSSFEVIVVDSNSTDGTVDVAAEYDVTVLEIPDDSLTTPSAGRYVGTRRARGDHLLYVDGDVALTDERWVPEALERVRSDPELAGVDGYLNERGDDDVQSVDYLHGVALYERNALAEVGGYHPYLEAWEDVDLGFELRLAGYELHRLPVVTGVHPTESSPFEQFRRWRRGYYAAGGQVCRKAIGKPRLLARWLRHFADKFVALGWLVAGFVFLVVQPLLVLGWLAATAVGGTALCARMGVSNGLQRGLSFLLFPAGFVLGFRRLPPRDSFPTEVVQTVCRSDDHEVVAASAE